MTNFNELSKEQLIALLQAAKAQGQRKVTCKVSEKGALSVYGLGRFPVTLYVGQWERLAQEMPQVMEFAKANAALLATKD